MSAHYQRDVKNMKNPCFPDVPQNAGGTPLADKHEKFAFRLRFFLIRGSSGFVPPMFPYGFVQKHWKPHLCSTIPLVRVGRSTKTCLWQIKILKLEKANPGEQGFGQPSGKRDPGQRGHPEKKSTNKTPKLFKSIVGGRVWNKMGATLDPQTCLPHLYSCNGLLIRRLPNMRSMTLTSPKRSNDANH